MTSDVLLHMLLLGASYSGCAAGDSIVPLPTPPLPPLLLLLQQLLAVH